ncbi:flagellar hook-length control protein FliK [Marinimicrobium sp. C6131]|uniref:flagellar hook-length control protein FliK n=1 Tax=Marinimicrobium sp. C6131 TaxID=3022676 RepID=UPI00223E5928|nr:flagellar hook-length control protein FliK [Marinimicrobium sp. C6131]UZJ45231.1 flagellar hook-length control protein FliK [Marinimicrobium sp. C6131]
MPGHSQISSLLSFNSEASPVRRRAAPEGEGFRQVFEGTASRASSSDREQASLPERSESREGVKRESASAQREADVRDNRPDEGATSGRAAENEATRTNASQRPEASPSDSGAAGASHEGESDGSTVLSRDDRALLADLSSEDWGALSEDVTALLEQLKSQLDEGSLAPELEKALRQLLADLKDGAPLDQVAESLDAIPVTALPELAARFPGATTLRDAIGRTGAAYLSQLSAMASQRPAAAGASGPDVGLPMAISGDKGAEGLDLKGLLELSVSAGKNGKEAFAQTLQAISEASAQPASRASTSFDGGQSPANALAQLESANRGQPLSPTERGFTVQTDVRVPVGQGQWGQAVGQKVLWMASQKLSSAELRLDPPDLGPMQVRVSANQDQISVTFTSPQAAVREALDQNANRLREMFAEQGLDLVDVNVSDQSGREQADEDGEGRTAGRALNGDADDPEAEVIEQRISDRLVDHYA